MLQSVLHGKDRKRQADLLVARFATMKPGDQITHAEIEAIIGEKYRPTNGTRSGYPAVIQKAIRMLLLKHGVKMQTVCGSGYSFPDGTTQMNRAVLRGRSAVKQYERTVVEVAVVADDRLSDGDRSKRDFYLTRAKQLHDYAQAEQKALTIQFNKPAALPK